MPQADLLLGLDVGTSTCKAAVIGATGVELAHGQAPTPWRRVAGGAEIDPEALFATVAIAARVALAAAPAGRIRAIGVASMAEAGVLLDASDCPLHPAIAWHDARGVAEARRLAEELPAFSARTGLPPTPLSSVVKLAHLGPSVTARAVRWLSIAEWVVKRLGGEETTEPSLASRTGMFDLHARAPYADALAWAGLPDDLLAPPAPAGAPVGRATLPEARGAVLTVAGHDHLVAGVGVGVVAPGDALDSCGTAEALARIVAPPLTAEQVVEVVAGDVTVGWHVAPERQALQAALWSGLALREVLTALGVDNGARPELGALAAAAPPEEAPALELDLRSAERRPPQLPSAEPHLVWRAAVDAAAAEAQRVMTQIDAVAGSHRRLVVTGGLARDPAFLAAKRERGGVSAPPVLEAGCRGAALLAGVAAGLYADADHLPPPP